MEAAKERYASFNSKILFNYPKRVEIKIRTYLVSKKKPIHKYRTYKMQELFSSFLVFFSVKSRKELDN